MTFQPGLCVQGFEDHVGSGHFRLGESSGFTGAGAAEPPF